MDYLLNPGHPDNGSKVQFLASQGFGLQNWAILAVALRRLAQTTEITERTASPHGEKYVVDGRLETPSGKSPVVRTIWIVDRGSHAPWLVTAYPRQAGGGL